MGFSEGPKDHVEPRLMDVDRAKREFLSLKKKLSPKCPLPTNKQKEAKKGPAYFTCIINMLIEATIDGLPCDYDPRALTTVTVNNSPLRTLARRVDGAASGIETDPGERCQRQARADSRHDLRGK